jgi:hypothetical protein
VTPIATISIPAGKSRPDSVLQCEYHWADGQEIVIRGDRPTSALIRADCRLRVVTLHVDPAGTTVD